MRITIPDDLHEELGRVAQAERVSRSGLIEFLLRRGLKSDNWKIHAGMVLMCFANVLTFSMDSIKPSAGQQAITGFLLMLWYALAILLHKVFNGYVRRKRDRERFIGSSGDMRPMRPDEISRSHAGPTIGR